MRRIAYLTQFWIPALLNPVINKIADEDNVLVVLTNQREAEGNSFVFADSPDVSLGEVKGNISSRGKTNLTGFPRKLTLSVLLHF